MQDVSQLVCNSIEHIQEITRYVDPQVISVRRNIGSPLHFSQR